MKNKPFFIVVILTLVAAAAGAALFFSGTKFDLRISESQIQEQLNQKFPFEKRFFSVLWIRFKSPILNLEEGSDRINFGCQIESNMGQTGVDRPAAEDAGGLVSGMAKISGSLRYEPNEGAFYLNDPRVDDLVVPGVPEKYLERARRTITKAAAQFLRFMPIYKLKPEDSKQAAAKLILRQVIVKNRELVVTLGLE